MRILLVALMAAVVLAGNTDAQTQTGPQRRQLLQQIVERLLENGRVQAGLTEEQFSRYSEIARRSIARRNEIQRRESDLWRALEGQMRPGIAADEDSTLALLDSLVAIPNELVELRRAEQRDYSEFLSPVQRAQLMLLHRRFENNIQQIMRRRLTNRPVPANR